jgi:hypothetical protein
MIFYIVTIKKISGAYRPDKNRENRRPLSRMLSGQQAL